jgi:hypothetical protein
MARINVNGSGNWKLKLEMALARIRIEALRMEIKLSAIICFVLLFILKLTRYPQGAFG